MAEDPQSDPLIGQTLLDKLKVIRKLGGGGMGSVYEVEHLITRHRRALKLIKPEYVKRRSYMRRLIREAGVAGQLQTPYVVETYDAGTMEDGAAYVLMELLDGEQLIELLEREDILPLGRLVGIMVQLCEGVAVAHKTGIVHRDLKPENIFLVAHPSGHERVKILDFGISKFRDNKDQTSRLTAEGTILGTPFYMSPEQAAAREVDERTDVYAVGVMMYEALTGRLPFDAKSVGALFIKIAAGEYLPLKHYRPDIPEEFAAIVEKAMHRDLAKRFQSMESLRSALVPYAPGDLRIRAKTISDSPMPHRSTLAYDHVPPAPAVPKHTLSMGPKQDTKAAPETMAAPESEPPAVASAAAAQEEAAAALRASRPSARPSNRGAWIAAAAILGVAAAVAFGLFAADDDGEPAPEPVAAEPAAPAPEAESETPAELAEPGPAAEAQAVEPAPPIEAQRVRSQVATERAETEHEPPRRPAVEHRSTIRPIERRHETPAERAGLDPNPYGN